MRGARTLVGGAAPAFRTPLSSDLVRFADEVGRHDPVVAVGGRSQWHVGGAVAASAREVRAPSGIVLHQPDEMIVRVGAATPVAELTAALAAAGQCCPLDPPTERMGGTVGGVLAVGASGVRRLRHGHVRDLLLEARYVTAAGEVSVAGAPLVKNVTGYDLCRLLVGSLGTLGLLGEVVLRCKPLATVAQWHHAQGVGVDVFALRRRMFAPSSVLWDGVDAWVLLEGEAAEVDAERRAAAITLQPCDGPPMLPVVGRWSMAPRDLPEWPTRAASQGIGRWVAEIGVGVVHADAPAPSQPLARPELHASLKAAFDPTGRLAPGRLPW